MSTTVLLLVGVAAAVFVGANIGGSSTGVAFGPAAGAGPLSTGTAAALMAGFVLLGGWTVGRHVIATMGGRIVPATAAIGEERPADLREGHRLFDPAATGRVIILRIFSPSAAAGVSFAFFSLAG